MDVAAAMTDAVGDLGSLQGLGRQWQGDPVPFFMAHPLAPGAHTEQTVGSGEAGDDVPGAHGEERREET